MGQRSRVGRGALVASLVLLAVPAAASARGPSQFVIGPVAVGHGYRVLATSLGWCNASRPSPFSTGPTAAVELIKSIPGGTEVHFYYGDPAKATCNMSTGVFKLSLGKLATIDVRFRPHGRSWQGNRSLYFSCDGPGPVIQPGTATGTFRIDIDPSYFGSVDLHRTTGSIQREHSTQCGQGPRLQVLYGRPPHAWSAVEAGVRSDGRRWLALQTNAKTSGSVTVIHEVFLDGGTRLFSFTHDLSSATINGLGGPVTGQLRYTEKPHHPGYGRLSGRLRVAFDLIGTMVLNGSRGAAELS